MKNIMTICLLFIAYTIGIFAEQLQYPMNAVYNENTGKYYVAQNNFRLVTLSENLRDAELFQVYNSFPIIATYGNILFVGHENTIFAYLNAQPNNGVSAIINNPANLVNLSTTDQNGTFVMYAHLEDNNIYKLSEINPLSEIIATPITIDIGSDIIVNIYAKKDIIYIATKSDDGQKSNLYAHYLEAETTKLIYSNSNDPTIVGVTEDNNNHIFIAFMGLGDNSSYIVRMNKDNYQFQNFATNLPLINSISYRADNDNLILAMNQINEVRLILANKPPKVTLLTPEKGSLLDDNKVTFSWLPISGITQYKILIAKDKEYVDVVKSQFTSQANTDIITLDYDTKYYWKVMAINFGIEGDWSNTFDFTINPLNLVAPTLIEPANNSENVSLTPKFVWSKFKPNYQYEIQVSTTSDFSNILKSARNLLDTFVVFPGPFEEDKSYFWRVRTYVNLEEASPWSGTFKFSTKFTMPAAAILEYPQYNEVNVSMLPLFRWGAVEGASFYKLELSKDINFIEVNNTFRFDVPSNGEATQTYKITDSILTHLTHYYWRVKAMTARGETEWSEIWRFQTINKLTPNSVYESLSNNSLYPMPASDYLFIKRDDFLANDFSIKLFTSNGQEIKNLNYTISNDFIKLDVINLNNGLYNIVIETPKGNYINKFIKN